jgi:membrane-bound ClpP family serine protease
MANFLALDLDPSRVHTVAYVPREARADAALIALSCDEIVLGPDAELGGYGSYTFALGEIAEMTKSVQLVCEKKARSWSLPAAMYDPDLPVFRCTRPGLAAPAYFCEAELAQQAQGKRWIKGEQVTTAGKPFLVRGADAARYFPAARVVGDFAELKLSYNLEADPALLEPGWVDALVDVLTTPAVRILLLVIGFVALYIELHSPGIGVPGFLATVCFVLFFWSQFGRTAGWLEVALFLAGLTCVLLELFVIPGFGIFGLGGGVMILASIVLASQTFVIPRNPYEMAQFQKSLLVVGASIAGIIGAIALVNRWLPETPLLGQMVLNPPSGEEAEAIDSSAALTHFEDLLGMRGATTTPLVPGGKARIGKNLYDVMTDGEFVPRNAAVEVVEIRGNWIVVRPIDAES